MSCLKAVVPVYRLVVYTAVYASTLVALSCPRAVVPVCHIVVYTAV